jgi:predicted NUDIX family phosphoesterase/dephospho-CoA kinase
MGKFLDAAQIILRRRDGEEMDVSLLTDMALAEGLLENTNGQTPVQTMKAKLSVDIRTKGKLSRFMRVAPGRFKLRDLVTSEYVAKPFAKTSERHEKVMVFPAKALERIGSFHGIRRDVHRYLPLLKSSNTQVLPRVSAETNIRFKQVISYVIIRRKSSILRFVRGSHNSVQSFLKGRLCIGFGGHAQAEDPTLFDESDDSGYHNSVVRELTEELKLPPDIINEDTLQFLGVLNDESSIVGQLHFAFLHILDISDLPEPLSAKSLKKEKSINQLRFIPTSRLGDEYEGYEYWSKLCIQEFFKGSVTVKCHVRPVRNFSLARHSENIAVVGTIGSGKTEVSTLLKEKFGYQAVNTGELVQSLIGQSIKDKGRGAIQTLAQTFIKSESGPERLAEAIVQQIKNVPNKPHLIDGLRNLSTFELLRKKLSGNLTLLYVESTVDNAFLFYRNRENPNVTFSEFIEILSHPVESEIAHFLRRANVVIFNHGTKRSYQIEVQRYFRGELRK